MLPFLTNLLYIRFLSHHTESFRFKLTDPHLRPKIAVHNVYWNRFQAKTDKHLYYLSGKLKSAGLVHSRFVDRWHITNIIKVAGNPAIPVTTTHDFLTIFSPEELIPVYGIFTVLCPELKQKLTPPPVPQLPPPVPDLPPSPEVPDGPLVAGSGVPVASMIITRMMP